MGAHPGKTPAQRRALDKIGCGNHSPIMAKATRDALLRAGLIIELPPYEDNRHGLRFVMRRFEMPIPVHIQWCEAMSEEGDREQVATCESCGAPLFDGDDYAADDHGVFGCWPTMTDDPCAGGRPCYAERVGKPISWAHENGLAKARDAQ